MRLFNSLTKKIEELAPINPPKVKVYTCGPTVYSRPTIGNWRTYTTADFLLRSLKYIGFEPTYVMNLTDVGHLTGDNEGDADMGEDRLEKAAKREHKTAWDIAKEYSEDFLYWYGKLNLTKPIVFAKATDHIKEQIDLIKQIEQKGFAYKIDDSSRNEAGGIYFDVKKYEDVGNDYGRLSTLNKIKAGARVEPNPQKHDPRDFALWKFSPKGDETPRRHMEWNSPWGVGFPGWHIECSAMSMKYLGEQFDIHLGGEDLRSTHHPNEIAQSEAATGKKPFVKYWVHIAFLMVDGKRMGKSLGNAYTMQDLAERGYSPFDLKYFYATGHYQKQLNFTFEALNAAKSARERLVQIAQKYKEAEERTILSNEKLAKVRNFQGEFKSALEDNLNMPQALAVVWEAMKSNIPDYDKYDLLQNFDEVLGLGIMTQEIQKMPWEIVELLKKRDELRAQGKFDEADAIRDEIEKRGFTVQDSAVFR
jgi:cysteinyl-tRNA synthetase